MASKKLQLLGTIKTPAADWTQTDETQSDYIKNKPDLGLLSSLDEVGKDFLATDVQESLNKIDNAENIYETKADASTKLVEAKAYSDANFESAKLYTDSVVNGKSDSDHDHDTVYDAIGSADASLAAAKSYTDSIASEKADADHAHDDRYYTETEADTNMNSHNTATDAHNDIRVLIADLATKLNAFLDVDDTTSDQLSEVLALIENNKGTLESLTTSKVNVSDIIDNLTTNVSNKPLSAAQGVALKALIDAITVPTKTSELENDSGFLTDDDIPEDAVDNVELPQEWTDINQAYEEFGEPEHKLLGGILYKDFDDNIQVFPLARPYGIRTDEVGEEYAQSSIAMYNSAQQLLVKPGTDGRHTVSLRQLDEIFGGGSASDLSSEKIYSIGKNNIPPVDTNDPQPYVFGRDENNVFSAKNYNEAAIANNLIDRDAQGKAKVEAPDVNSTTPDNKHIVNVDYANRKYLAKTGGIMTGKPEIKTSNPAVKLTDTADSNSVSYVQAYQGKTYMGYSAAKSISVDKNGNGNVPGNLTVVGSISCGEPKNGTDAVTVDYLNNKLDNLPTPDIDTTEIDVRISQLEAKVDSLTASAVTVYSGLADPTNDTGEDGDLYLVIE